MRKIWKLGILGVWIVLLGFIHCEQNALAAGAVAYFGTEEGYQWNLGESSPMGFYLEGAEDSLTEAELIITYDPEILECVSVSEEGVTALEEGKLSLKQVGDIGARYKRLINFLPLMSANTTVEIVKASGKTVNGEVVVEQTVVASVNISLAEGCELGNIEIDGKSLQGFESGKQHYELEVENEVENLSLTADAGERTQVEISDTVLAVGVNQINITTTNENKQKARYVLLVTRKEAVAEVRNVVGENGTTDESGEVVVLDEVIDESVTEEESVTFKEKIWGNQKLSWKQQFLALAVVLVGILLVVELVLFIFNIKKQKERRKAKLENKTKKVEDINLDKSENAVVIRGKNICMDFDRAVNEYSSIKELAIQTLKGTKVKEKYRALNNISFEIQKGEVIGVIGTNGAGKSTLLKIIAGAMRPTSGSVQADRNKIQILTLGTGFDRELTGKENVYLNGAIIGYKKEFIDENYDKIVEFAELQDFMNEKVKNYSSGMVSRLGFAIATVGEAAEILILDEVLSVGDRIFRQKSMKRIKEMIHGGSTVIMVSHSTQTIRENCNRAIWIEKGQMIAMGDVKKLCEAYDKYDGNLENALKIKRELSMQS